MNEINIEILRNKMKMLSQRLGRCNREQNIASRKNIIENECERYIEFIMGHNKDENNLEEIISVVGEVEYLLVNEHVGENLTQDRVMRIIENKILSNYVMKYDKSGLINPDTLATMVTSKGEEFKIANFHPNKEKITIYQDEKVKIEQLGLLHFKHPSALAEYITKYRIIKDDKTYEVYSEISATDMQEDELYKEAVLEVLLGDNNLRLSNCSGYIGTIENVNQKNKGVYNINNKYCLSAESAEATAAHEYRRTTKILEQRKKEQREKEQKKQRFNKMLGEIRDL